MTTAQVPAKLALSLTRSLETRLVKALDGIPVLSEDKIAEHQDGLRFNKGHPRQKEAEAALKLEHARRETENALQQVRRLIGLFEHAEQTVNLSILDYSFLTELEIPEVLTNYVRPSDGTLEIPFPKQD